MKLIIATATPQEIAPLLNYLEGGGFRDEGQAGYRKKGVHIQTLITGVGSVAMAASITPLLYAVQPDMAICMGIAGAFPGTFSLGDVVNVQSQQFGDLGIEEADGTPRDLFEIGLADPNDFPFTQGMLENPSVKDAEFLPLAHGLTVNRVHGEAERIEETMKRYDVQVESMEGAAFFYACLLAEIPFLEIRAISNIVEPRNRDAWKIDIAIRNLNSAVIDMIEIFAVGP